MSGKEPRRYLPGCKLYHHYDFGIEDPIHITFEADVDLCIEACRDDQDCVYFVYDFIATGECRFYKVEPKKKKFSTNRVWGQAKHCDETNTGKQPTTTTTLNGSTRLYLNLSFLIVFIATIDEYF